MRQEEWRIVPGKKVPIEERFWQKVAKGAPEDCWLWLGAVEPSGYAKITERYKKIYVHRFAYELAHGPIPPGRHFQICHSCDTRLCVNPRHLWIGTARANKKEAIERKRLPIGTEHWNAKLNDDLVREMRRRYRTEPLTIRQIADEYGHNFATVAQMLCGRTWKHVE